MMIYDKKNIKYKNSIISILLYRSINFKIQTSSYRIEITKNMLKCTFYNFYLMLNYLFQIYRLSPYMSYFYTQIFRSVFESYLNTFILKPKMDLKKLKILKKLFINGKWTNGVRGKSFDVINPTDETVIANIAQATNQDVDIAVKAARQAFDNGPWSRMDPTDRQRCLYRLADLIEKNAQQLATLQSLNNGKPAHIALAADVNLSHKTYRYYAGWVDKITGTTINADGPFFAYTTKQPVGVVGQIIPWNFPMLMQAWKLAPALAAGCTVVMKTAEQTPLTGLRIAQLIQQAGFPPGVVNILNGYGQAGAYLSRHKGIDKVAFTGSTEVGYDIMRNAHKQNLKRISLQLGGKSANIISQHANFQKAVSQSTMGLFFNAGQCCIAGSRTFVHSSIYDKYVQRVVEAAKCIKLGNPLDKNTDQGPLVSKEQMDRVLSYVQHGKADGAKLLAGGKRHGTKGFFVQPTVFAGVTDSMRISQEEIFGPVMSILKYDNFDQVIERANKSNYGLGAGIVSDNISEVLHAQKKLKAGTVYVNCWNVFQSSLPFGGYKDSGIGRDLGQEGIKGYLQNKTTIIMKH